MMVVNGEPPTSLEVPLYEMFSVAIDVGTLRYKGIVLKFIETRIVVSL